MRTPTVLKAIALSFGCCVAPALAQQSTDAPPVQQSPESSVAPETPALDMPGIEHAFLAKRAGRYTTTTRFRSAPDAEPDESTGTATIEAILDGRFICEDNSGSLAGDAFSGRRIMGFNNRSERFEASWFYSNSSAMLILVGESTDLGETIELQGTYEGAPGRMYPINVRIRHLSADRFVVEILSNTTDGSPYVMLETTYTRIEK